MHVMNVATATAGPLDSRSFTLDELSVTQLHQSGRLRRSGCDATEKADIKRAIGATRRTFVDDIVMFRHIIVETYSNESVK